MPARCRTRSLARRRTCTVHTRSLLYIHCTRPLAVVHSLYTPARCHTFTEHARSLSYIHCTRPLAVVHSLHTPARCRTFTAHARSLSYTLTRSLSYTPAPRCRLLVVTEPLAGPPCLPSASSPIVLCTLRMTLPDTSVADLRVYSERRIRSLHSLCIYVRRQTTDQQ